METSSFADTEREEEEIYSDDEEDTIMEPTKVGAEEQDTVD